MGEDGVDDGRAYAVCGFQRGDAADVGGGNGLGGGVAWGLLRVVGGGPQSEEAAEVRAAHGIEAGEGFGNSGVLHGGHGEAALAVCVDADPVLGPVAEDDAVPVGIGGKDIAFEDEGRTLGVGEAGVGGAEVGDFGRVDEGNAFGEGEGPVGEFRVEGVGAGFGTPSAVGLRFGAGAEGADGEDAVGPAGGSFAGIHFLADVGDDPFGPCSGTDGGHLGVDAGDAGGETVGVGEGGAGVEPEGHD